MHTSGPDKIIYLPSSSLVAEQPSVSLFFFQEQRECRRLFGLLQRAMPARQASTESVRQTARAPSEWSQTFFQIEHAIDLLKTHCVSELAAGGDNKTSNHGHGAPYLPFKPAPYLLIVCKGD